MQELRDLVRSKVDDLRSAGERRSLDAAAIVNELAATLASQPRQAGEGRDPATPHMCPWHTCQATRHN